MALQTFNFPYHTFRTEYPESGTRVQLGGSYIFTAPPDGPDLRRITLNFPVMFYYLQSDGVTIDTTTNPTYNMAVLEAFYNTHKMYKSFTYPHPVYGNMTVKFFTPLRTPEGIPGGRGATKDFTIELIEIQN